MSSALIYAELLSNIRQISILAELPTPSDHSTQVSLSPNKKSLSLIHEGSLTKLDLPGEVNPSYEPQQPSPGLSQISWRIPLKGQSPQIHPSFVESPSAPWDASALNSSSAFDAVVCGACSANIVSPGTIKTWQDLPSANWAEMMDFWHCHKPDVPKVEQNGTESGLVEKGYGATASFRAQKGVGKVDLMTFLLSKEDCAVSMPSDSDNNNCAVVDTPLSCLCASCSAVLGVFDASLSDVRLNKWTLRNAPPLSHFLIPHLVSLTASLAVSKFLLHGASSPSSAQTNIFVWLFAPSLTVSFGSQLKDAPPRPPMKAAKLFYRVVDNAEAEKLIDTGDASVEEVKLPEADVAALLNVLVSSTCYLPSSASKFGDWRVGILSRGE